MKLVLKTTITTIAIAMGLFATALPVRAGYHVTFDSVTPGDGYDAGQYNWHFDDGTSAHNAIAGPSGIVYSPGSPANSHFATFCIQTNQYITFNGHYTYNFAALGTAPTGGSGTMAMGNTAADSIRLMWKKWRSDIDVTDSFGTKYEKSEAFQFAVWHFAGQTPPYPLGHVSGSGNVATLYNKYINITGLTDMANLVAMVSGDNQDQLVELEDGYGPGGGGGLRVVPAPPALILALAGIVPCIALRRRLTATTA